MATKFVILCLIGTAMQFNTADLSARERPSGDRGGCSFCAPQYVAVEPAFNAPESQARPQSWIAYSAGPYTRFDIEGIRLMTRMP